MKAILKIYGRDYEIDIKARNCKNLKASKQSTLTVLQWIEARLWDSSHEYKDKPDFCHEVRQNAHILHGFVNEE